MKINSHIIIVSLLAQIAILITPFPAQAQSIQTATSQVSASSDDAEERLSSGTVKLSSSDLELGAEDGSNKLQLVGMRFNDLSVPASATVTKAYIEFEVDEHGSAATSVVIKGQAQTNPSVFVRQYQDLSLRATTIATIYWNDIPPWAINEKQPTPNISPIIQEIVNQPDWSAGSSLVIFIEGAGRRTAEAYNGESTNAPLLVVEYSTDDEEPPPPE